MDHAINSIMSKEIRSGADEAFFIDPGELALAITAETITVPDDLVGWLDGRSSRQARGPGDQYTRQLEPNLVELREVRQESTQNVTSLQRIDDTMSI